MTVCTTPHENEMYEQIVQENIDHSMTSNVELGCGIQPVYTILHSDSFEGEHDKCAHLNHKERVILSDNMAEEQNDNQIDNVLADNVHLVHGTDQKTIELDIQSLQNQQISTNDTSIFSLHGVTRKVGQDIEQKGTAAHCNRLGNEGVSVQTELKDSVKSSVPLVVYDKFCCAWLNESLTDIDAHDEPTYNKPDTPYVTFDISQSNLKTPEKDRLRQLLRNAKQSFVDSTDTLGLNVTFPCRIILKEDAVPKVIRPFRIPFHLQAEMQKSIKQLQENGIMSLLNIHFGKVRFFSW